VGRKKDKMNKEQDAACVFVFGWCRCLLRDCCQPIQIRLLEKGMERNGERKKKKEFKAS